MEASVVDLRYRMKEVLKALDRRENVTILHHGKPRGTIVPVPRKKKLKVRDHAFFGMASGDDRTVNDIMKDLRGARMDVV